MNKLTITQALPLSALLLGLSSGAAAVTPDDFLAWVKANQSATPSFKDGDQITFKNADAIRPFVPPGYQDEMIFDGMDVVVRDATDLSPPAIYNDATKKFFGQATLAEDGALENYTAGLPFDPATIKIGDSASGLKMVWNFNYRWQHEGLSGKNSDWIWVRAGGNHDNHDIMKGFGAKYFGGGGTFERWLKGKYKRVYLSHRADLADTDYKVQSSWAKNTEFREITEFFSPFDIAGTAFIVLRYDNPRKVDDGWAYVPSLRRVRRISADVKSDSLLGTDHTLEDFYCFSGRVLEHDWNYIGTARMLAVARSRYNLTNYYGPNGWTPKDDWELREVNVFQQVPKSGTHPYSMKYIVADKQHGSALYCNAFDQQKELWKVWQLSKVWTDDPHYTGEAPKGMRMSAFQNINVIDKQNGRGTLVTLTADEKGNGGPSYPDNSLKQIRRQLDVNRLTEGR